ncbi:MAG TPA: tetratricopeptide repeat protein [Spirochaetota bacterium]|nr:tetratricopeptide repeat protein [Spirochaetota bacterium]
MKIAITICGILLMSCSLYDKYKLEKDIKEYSYRINDKSSRENIDLLYSCRGLTYLQLKDYDKAIEDFKKAISIDPFYDYYYYLAQAYLYKKDINKAYESIIQINEKDCTTLSYAIKGFCGDMLQKDKNAIHDYLKFTDVVIMPTSAYYVSNARLSYLFYQKGEYQKAMECVYESIKISNNVREKSDDLIYFRFLANLGLKKYDEAKSDLLFILKRGFNDKIQYQRDIEIIIDNQKKEEFLKLFSANVKKNKDIKKIDFFDKEYLIDTFLVDFEEY